MKKPKIISSRPIYSDSYIRVMHDRVLFQTHEWNQIYLDKIYKNSVVIIPVTTGGVYLVKQYRHPIQKFVWQFPAGTSEKNSHLLQLAQKELKEETGMVAQKITKIGAIYSEPGLSTDKTTVYIARKLNKINKQNLDRSEIGMDLRFFKFDTFDTMIQEGKIMCGITLSAYLLYIRLLKTLAS